MGVSELWSILEPVKHHVPLHSLAGKTLAVDLSIWVCEAQMVKQMIGVVHKPHLRNLFFRVSSLSLMGVKLVFVSEGEPPKIKAGTMNKRNEMRYGTTSAAAPTRPGRSYFKSVLKECLQMLECLGIPWVQAAGEAEAMCAYLNAKGYVDGCITNDGDVFLYGAQTVYRNFTMNVKDPHVDSYEASSIKDKLGLDREALVGLAILLGCDYLPKGVPGVRKIQALSLIQQLKGESLLQRFYQWKKESDNCTTKSAKKRVHCSVCCHPGSAKEHERNGCKLCGSDKYCEPHDYDYRCPCEWHKEQQEKQDNPVEYVIRRKAMRCEGFPYPQVIQEFLINKDKLVKVLKWLRPNLLCFQNFTADRMEWPKHYACEKLLALLTYYDMNERKAGREHSTQLQALRIVKTRIKNGIPCFEIEWMKPDGFVFPSDHPPESLPVTIEEELLFQDAYPQIVALFHKEKQEAEENKLKIKKNKPKFKAQDDADDVASLLSELSLKPVSEKLLSLDLVVDTEISASRQDNCPHSGDFADDSLPAVRTLLDTEPEVFSAPSYSADMETPLRVCSSLAQTNTQQPDAASPNVSALVSELQLSSIDWDATSFTESPLAKCCSSALRSSEAGENEENFRDRPTTGNPEIISGNLSDVNKERVLSNISNVEKNTESNDLHVERLQKLPLKDRILIKNALHSGAPHPQNVHDKPLHLKPVPLNLHKREATKCISQNTAIPLISSISSKEKVQQNPHPNILRESRQEENIKPSIPAIKPAGFSVKPSTVEGHTTKSYKFVNNLKKISLKPVRNISSSGTNNSVEIKAAPRVMVKKSVCHKEASSSDDSDIDETSDSRYLHEKPKKSYSTLNHFDSRVKATLSVAPCVNTRYVPAHNHVEVSPPHTNTVHSSGIVNTVCLSPEHKSNSTPCTDSAGQESDGDDSIVSVDSPLPLSERLKLRLLQNY
ncbi:flap endonuclease GEN homolog 1 [Rhinophrynus dorsalis]